MPTGVSTEAAELVARVGRAAKLGVELVIDLTRNALMDDYYSPLTHEEIAAIRRVYEEDQK